MPASGRLAKKYLELFGSIDHCSFHRQKSPLWVNNWCCAVPVSTAWEQDPQFLSSHGGCLSTDVVRCQCSRVKSPSTYRCRPVLGLSWGVAFPVSPGIQETSIWVSWCRTGKFSLTPLFQRRSPWASRSSSHKGGTSGLLYVRYPHRQSVVFSRFHPVHFVTGQMVGDRRSLGRQYWGARLSTPSANHRLLGPPTDPVHRDGLWTVCEMTGPVLPDGCDVAASFGLAVAPAASSVCVDVAASLLPTVAAAANSALPTLRRHNISAAAEQTKHARGRARSWETKAFVHVYGGQYHTLHRTALLSQRYQVRAS